MVKQFLVKDVFETYGYFFIDEKSAHGFLIDPGAEADKLYRVIQAHEWHIEKIILTHGHFDHFGAVEELSQRLGIPYMIHKNGKEYLTNTGLNLSSYCEREYVLEDALYFEDGTILFLEGNPDFSLQVIHTPGHTPDSVVLYNGKENIAFVGDTIFKGSIGNAGYPGGNVRQLQESIIHTIFRFPEETKLYSGHSDVTTVGAEKSRYGF